MCMPSFVCLHAFSFGIMLELVVTAFCLLCAVEAVESVVYVLMVIMQLCGPCFFIFVHHPHMFSICFLSSVLVCVE